MVHALALVGALLFVSGVSAQIIGDEGPSQLNVVCSFVAAAVVVCALSSALR
jgi:hypothetical protein